MVEFKGNHRNLFEKMKYSLMAQSWKDVGKEPCIKKGDKFPVLVNKSSARNDIFEFVLINLWDKIIFRMLILYIYFLQ